MKMKPPVKFLSFVLGITSLLSLIFLIYPRSLSPQTSSVALETTAPPSLDFDGSGIVDFPDFLMFVSAFGSEEGQDKYDAKYDLNSDGKIAFEDFLILTDNFGKNVVAQKSPTSSDQDASTTQSMAENTGATGTTLPVTSLEESVVASTPQPLTEATLDGSVVKLTLSGATYESFSFDIRDNVKVSGITGVTFDSFFDVDRVSDTVVTVELTFNGNMTTDGTLTFTVEAGAIADYTGPALTTTLPVTALQESVVASTPQPLTEATLDGSVVTLTLTGRSYEGFFAISDAVKVSGIAGVTFDSFFDVDRVSDTVVTVELTFNGNMTTNGTLTFTVEADAIVGYNGPALTATLPVTALEESVVASTPQPLKEATLDGSVVTLTLSGATYESFSFDIRDNVKVSGIDGVSVETFRIQRVSDTVVTVELTFNGNMTTDGTLSFTVEADAIVGYNGPALTATLPVTTGPGSDGGRGSSNNPDLIVELRTVTHTTLGPEEDFTLSATVLNQGGSRSVPTTLRYYLSTDETITTGDTEVETSSVFSLDPSETDDERAYLNAPLSEGTYYYGACVDAVSGESDTSNNCSSAVTVSVSGSDLIVESLLVDNTTLGPEEDFTLSATVLNQGGSRSASTTLRYYLSTDENITTSDTEIETSYVSRLDPSETDDERAYLNAPSSEGTYYYGACVDAVSGESDTSNNCSSAVTITVSGSDLIVESPTVSNSSPGPGASFTLNATVLNQGGSESSSTTLRYYLSTDEIITTGDTEIETSYVSSLDPSETSGERAYLNAPSSEGTYYYGACVDAVSGESDTSNNCSSAVTITVLGSDLIVESPTVSNSSPGPGASFTLNATVLNQGGSRSNYTTLRYYLSTDETITTGDTEIETDYVSSLDPSETSDERAYLEAPSSEGTYYYGACVDSVTGESDTGNNCSSAVTVTVSGSDLVVDSPTVSESNPKAGASFRLYATVRNQGGSRSDYTTLRYYLSTDVTINTNDQEIETDYVSRLAPSETSEESAYLNAPSSAGTYYYGACVEAVSGESDTSNNCSSAITITVGGTTPPPTPTPNQPPVFSEGTSTTRSIAENTGAGQNIGNPISATDGDGDRLTYSLEGRDARAFTIISGSGQLRTRSGVTYDYETKNSYSVTVRVQDSKGGSATIAVTITLTDENEAPDRPDAPTVTASTLNSLSLRWTAPTTSGSAISDYDVQYKAAGGSFTDWPHTGTSTNTTITGLTANTRYEVQVRARNAQGVSNWSPSATGTTTANQSPVFSEGTSTTRSIAENTGAGQNIGNLGQCDRWRQ